ncbi:MAG: dihydrofolate reductase family protein, partial [Bacteroidota bacterium]
PQTEKVRYINPTDWELPALLTQLYQKENIGSILVEGGARVLNDFIDRGLYDEIYQLIGKTYIANGLYGPLLPDDISLDYQRDLGEDHLFYGMSADLKQLLL